MGQPARPPAPDFVPGSGKELNAIHAVVMGVGDDWPDVEGDPYTLRHVKWMARELNASVSRDNKVEKLRQSLLTIWRSGVDDLDHHCRYPALEFFGCKHFHELEKLGPLRGAATQCTVERIYIAGPMTGLPDFNYPAFNRAARILRAKGYHVENPADNPVPPCGTWRGYMLMAIAQLITCDTVALLPGWSDSKGAQIEHQLARDLDLQVLDPWQLEAPLGG